MPFVSKSQQRFLYSQHPELAKRWRREYPGQDLKKLPEKKEDNEKAKKPEMNKIAAALISAALQ